MAVADAVAFEIVYIVLVVAAVTSYAVDPKVVVAVFNGSTVVVVVIAIDVLTAVFIVALTVPEATIVDLIIVAAAAACAASPQTAIISTFDDVVDSGFHVCLRRLGLQLLEGGSISSHSILFLLFSQSPRRWKVGWKETSSLLVHAEEIISRRFAVRVAVGGRVEVVLHSELHGGDVTMNDGEMEKVAAFGVDGVDVASVVDEHVEGLEKSAGAGGDEHRSPTFGVPGLFVDSSGESKVDHNRIANCRSLMQNRSIIIFRVDVSAAFDE